MLGWIIDCEILELLIGEELISDELLDWLLWLNGSWEDSYEVLVFWEVVFYMLVASFDDWFESYWVWGGIV